MLERPDLSPELEELRELSLNSIYFFGRSILGWDWLEPHVHKPLATFMEQMHQREQINLPRGFLKTTFATITRALWRVLPARKEYYEAGKVDPWHNPNLRILIVQNSRTNAMTRVNVLKRLVQDNQMLNLLFPEIIPKSYAIQRWSDSAAEIVREERHPEATWEAAGVGTALVSRHFNIIIEDDIIAARHDDVTGDEAIPSREEVEKAIGFHKTAVSLLANPKTGQIINVGTRWAKFDVIQHIIDHQTPPFVRFELSAIDKDGNPTYPERFDLKTLAAIKKEQGTYIYSSQYLNKPYDIDKMVFEQDWIKTYSIEPIPEVMNIYMAVDPAISKKKSADFSVVLCVGLTADRHIYILECVRKKINPTELNNEILSMYKRRNPKKVFIETVAFQEALSHFLKKQSKEEDIYLRVQEVKPRKSKEVRIRGLQPSVQRGDLHLKPYHKALRLELKDFPYGDHDDVADALAMVMKFARYPGGKSTPGEEKSTLEQLLKELREAARKTDTSFAPQVAGEGGESYENNRYNR